MNSSAKITRFSTTYSYIIQTSRPFCSLERQHDDLASASHPQTAAGTPSRTTTSASGANTNTRDLGASTSLQTRAAVWCWLLDRRVQRSNNRKPFIQLSMSLPPLATFPSANGLTGLRPALPAVPPPGELLQHPIQYIFQWPVLAAVAARCRRWDRQLHLVPVHRAVLSDFRASKHSRCRHSSRCGRRRRLIRALCTKRRAHIRRRQRAVWRARSVQPTFNIFPDQSWGSHGTAPGNIPITGSVGSRNGHVVWRV